MGPTASMMMRLRLAALSLAICLPAVPGGARADEARVSFNRHIRPILVDRCFKCHGPDENQRQAELRFDVRESAVASAVAPGKPDESELLARVSTDDADLRMPPAGSHKEPLSPEQIELFRRWIEQGAEYEPHWAFLPPQRPALPEVEREAWGRNPIDHFILTRLQREGLQPSPEADRRTLIRRVTLDLTGLPPSPEEVEAFVNDPSPDAYEKVVDRLLASDRYGEHMARYWLDAARYADTNGYQYDLERDQWAWRDWVIDAFNRNLPFDRFTIEQLAGDLLPDATDQQRLATGFNRNHPVTIEGGVIDEEYRTEYVVDRVVTTSTVWLGMTMLCGRCHDHKYDPISQREFYQFFAFFNQVPERGLNGFDPRIKVPSPLTDEKLSHLEREIAAAEEEYGRLVGREGPPYAEWERQLANSSGAWSVVVPQNMKSAGGAELTVQDDKSVVAGGENPATDTYELVLHLDEEQVRGLRLEALADPSMVNGSTGRGTNGNFVLSEFKVAVAPADSPNDFRPVRIASAEADYSQKNYPITAAVDGQADKRGWAVDGHEKPEKRTAVFTFAEPVGFAAGTRLRIRMIHNYGLSHQIGRFRLSVSAGAHRPPPLGLAKLLDTTPEKRSEEHKRQLREYLLERFGSGEVREVARRLEALRQERRELAQAAPATMVMSERSQPRTTHVLDRGEYDKPREPVEPGVPAAFPPLPDGAPANRLGLARWLVMPEHPLTARVTVNRFWQRLFGTGIVKTTEDFGSQGEWPSHPELLDWLAVEFVESGWDVKATLKRIVMSAAYRQSSKVTPELLARDRDNRLLARGPRMRLDAEVIRDGALAVSGLLVERLGGPSVFPYHPEGLWQEINNRPGYSRVYKRDDGEKLYRRSLYTFWKRTVPPPSMATFDAPEREFCVVRRSRTNTPLQAFVLLHDPQFVEAARHLAGRMMTEGGASVEDRLAHGFVLCTARRPDKGELEVLKRTYLERLEQYRKDPEAAQELLSVGASRRNEKLPLAEHAAWTTVARMLLNLSEFITKG